MSRVAVFPGSFDPITNAHLDVARRQGAGFVVRGLRAVSDFEFELQLAHTNRRLAPEVDTVFLMTALEHGYISSSLSKEVAKFGGDISAMVPGPVEAALRVRSAGG